LTDHTFLQATNSELSNQLSVLRRNPGTDINVEIRSLNSRVSNAERRATNFANQLTATEERYTAQEQKHKKAEEKWDARVKEYERMIKAITEKGKTEKQGSKEKIAELEAAIA
jgi:phage host-nuclease inhibitor protein Gam